MTARGASAQTGIVYLVGAGPGDPGLITVRGRELLAQCDAVVYDALANPALLPDHPELIDVGKRGGSSESARQDFINETLVALAKAGKRVVRLKGGDPFVFGRGSEEAQALAAAGIRFEVVPGVTAGIAAPAYAGIPVTHRGLATSVTFVTGHEDPYKPATQVDWAALAKVAVTGSVVLYMGVKTLPAIAKALMTGGLSGETPAAAVQWGTRAKQRTVVATLETLAGRAQSEGLTAPVISIVGPAVSLREEIAWFESRGPLAGRRVAVTRATAMPGTLSSLLRQLGADVLEAPSTEIEPLDPHAADDAVQRIASYDWLVLTSATGARFLADALYRNALDARSLAGLRIAVIGPSTGKALREIGLRADIIPERFVAESLLEALRAAGTRQGRILIATAEDGRTVLPDGLRALGADVDVVHLYRSRLITAGPAVDRLRAAIDAGDIDAVTFTSASTVSGFMAQVGAERAARIRAVSIGPVTSDALKAAGLSVAAEASEASIPSLADAVLSALPS